MIISHIVVSHIIPSGVIKRGLLENPPRTKVYYFPAMNLSFIGDFAVYGIPHDIPISVL